MEVGLALFAVDYTIAPARVAKLAEERGFESIFFPEHSHIPVSRETPYPGGGELPASTATPTIPSSRSPWPPR